MTKAQRERYWRIWNRELRYWLRAKRKNPSIKAAILATIYADSSFQKGFPR